MITKEQIIERSTSVVGSFNRSSNNPLDNVQQTINFQPVSYSKGQLSEHLEGHSAKSINRIIEQMESEGEYFVRNNSNHYTISSEQAFEIASRLGVKSIPELRIERDDYIVPVNIFNITKGGVGKSTTCAGLAVEATLDIKANQRVLLIDTDPQGTIIKMFSPLDLTNKFESLHVLLKEHLHLSREERLSEEYQNKFREFITSQLLCETHIDRLSVIPANVKDTNIDSMITIAVQKYGIDHAMNLYNDIVITPLKALFDIIFIDTSPAPNDVTANLYFASNHYTFVTSGRTQDMLAYISHWNYVKGLMVDLAPSNFTGAYSIKTVITKHIDNNTKQSAKMKKNVAKLVSESGCEVYNEFINENTKYDEAAEERVPLQLLASLRDEHYKTARQQIRNLYIQFKENVNRFVFEGV